MQKLVKAYNVNKWLRSGYAACNEKRLEAFGAYKELVVIEGPDGFVVTGSDGCHFMVDRASDTTNVKLCPARKEGDILSLCLVPTHNVDVPISQILDNCESREVFLGEFVRRFGARLEANYRLLLESLGCVGLNPEDYQRR